MVLKILYKFLRYTGSTIISQRQPTISVRTKEIRLVRDAGSGGDGFGIALRGGAGASGNGGVVSGCGGGGSNGSGSATENGKNGRSFVITFVKPNSPAER